MKKLSYITAFLMLISLSACQDLAVDNENSPNRALALAEPGDVETLIGDTFTNNWESRMWCSSGAMFLSTLADENSSSWANWGMRDMSSEPRIEWNNSPSYSRRASTENPWFDAYEAISNANDGLQAIALAESTESPNDNAFTRAGVDVTRLRAFAKFNQAWAHAWIAQMFDSGFIVDETVNLNDVADGTVVLELVPYQQVMATAIGMMDEAIAIAQSGSFTISADEDWIFGIDVTSEQLVQIANSFKAQWITTLARSSSERDAVDWNQIIALIDAGITEDFIPIGDDDFDVEEDCMKRYGNNGTTWSRADYRTIGAADESGAYQNWLNTPLQDRLVFDIVTSDRRIVGPDSVQQDGKYFQYQGNNGPFPAARGTYHYSSHNHKRYEEYSLAGGNGPMPYMLVTEMDMLKAEALLRTGGDLQMVVDLINKTRVPNGELNPATAADPVGALTDEHSHLDTASLWAKMKYEKRIEAFQTSAGLAYFDDRGWGDLVPGTPIHFPLPGKELETLGLQLYTFGGAGGNGAAPKMGTNLRNDTETLHRTQ